MLPQLGVVSTMRLVDADLGKQEVDVGARGPRARDDRDLARQRMRTAEPVHLPRIG